MTVFKRMQQMFQYVWSGALRIFSPTDDDYPSSGVQPFEGDPFESR